MGATLTGCDGNLVCSSLLPLCMFSGLIFPPVLYFVAATCGSRGLQRMLSVFFAPRPSPLSAAGRVARVAQGMARFSSLSVSPFGCAAARSFTPRMIELERCPLPGSNGPPSRFYAGRGGWRVIGIGIISVGAVFRRG